MSRVRRLALTTALLGASACVTEVAVRPTEDQIASLRLSEPSLDVSKIEAGRHLFTSRCIMCHAAPSPASRRPDAWPSEVAKMGPRANLDAEQTTAVLEYLRAASQPISNTHRSSP